MPRTILIAALLGLAAANAAAGQEGMTLEHDARRLAPLDSVRVMVRYDGHFLHSSEDPGLIRRLTTVAELELRKAGVPVANPDSRAIVLVFDFLTVEITEHELSAWNHDSYLLDVGTYRSKTLPFYEFTGAFRPWSGQGGVALYPQRKLRESIEDILRESAQSFANDWLAAH